MLKQQCTWVTSGYPSTIHYVGKCSKIMRKAISISSQYIIPSRLEEKIRMGVTLLEESIEVYDALTAILFDENDDSKLNFAFELYDYIHGAYLIGDGNLRVVDIFIDALARTVAYGSLILGRRIIEDCVNKHNHKEWCVRNASRGRTNNIMFVNGFDDMIVRILNAFERVALDVSTSVDAIDHLHSEWSVVSAYFGSLRYTWTAGNNRDKYFELILSKQTIFLSQLLKSSKHD